MFKPSTSGSGTYVFEIIIIIQHTLVTHQNVITLQNVRYTEIT